MSKKIKQIAVYDKDNGTWDSYQIQGNSSSAGTINATNVVLSSSILGSTNINDVLSTAFDSASTGLITGTTDRIVYVNGATKKLTSFGLTPNNIQTTIQKVGSSSVPNWGGPTNIMNLLGTTNISSSCTGFGDGTITGTIKDLTDSINSSINNSFSIGIQEDYSVLRTKTIAKNSTQVVSSFVPQKSGFYILIGNVQFAASSTGARTIKLGKVTPSGSNTFKEYEINEICSYPVSSTPGVSAVPTILSIPGIISISADDISNGSTIQLSARHTSSSNLATTSSLSYMYFYTPINLKNTSWILKDNIDLSSTFNYLITFNHTNPNGPTVTRIIANNGVLSYVISNSTVLVYNNGWVDNGYKVMNIRGGKDIMDQSLVDWLQSNRIQN